MTQLSAPFDLKLLSNNDLHEQTKLKAKAERIATTELLNHIVEVQRRKLFAELGYESLYAFCVRDLMMSEGDAVRYKNAAFLMRDCPEIEEKIIEGSLCFTNVAHIAAHVNAEIKAGFEVSLEQKKELVAQIESTSTRKAERILLSHAKRPMADVKESIRAVNETTAELKTPIDDEERRKAKAVEKNTKAAEKNAPAVDKSVQAFENNAQAENKRSLALRNRAQSQRSASTSLGFVRATRYTEKQVDHRLWLRDDGRCAHRNSKGERCEAKHFVQRDHIIPFADRGPNTLENLTLRCFAHNQLRARQRFGADKVVPR